MATASVLVPLSAIEQNGGVLPPSALVQHAPRHGRSRAASMKGKSSRGRRYSILENRDVTIYKAVAFILKRTTKESEMDSDEEGEGGEDEDNRRLVSNDEGWVLVADLLRHPKMMELAVSLSDLERIAESQTKARYAIRQTPDAESTHQIREICKRVSIQAPVVEERALSSDAEDLPEFVVYETSYEAYPRILAARSIQKAAGATYISFTAVTLGADGAESRQTRASDADVSIWVDLGAVMNAEPSIEWHRTAAGGIATTQDIPARLWKKAVARRPEIGMLFEDGQVRNEVPESLRGRGAKGKAKAGKVTMRNRGDAESDSASDE